MRVSPTSLAKVRVAAQASPSHLRNGLLAFGLAAFVGGAYLYTVAKMSGGGELAAVAAELEGFRQPTGSAPPDAEKPMK